jgi:hypothetical protein
MSVNPARKRAALVPIFDGDLSARDTAFGSVARISSNDPTTTSVTKTNKTAFASLEEIRQSIEISTDLLTIRAFAVASGAPSGFRRGPEHSERAEDSAHYSVRAAHCVCLSLHPAFVRITK